MSCDQELTTAIRKGCIETQEQQECCDLNHGSSQPWIGLSRTVDNISKNCGFQRLWTISKTRTTNTACVCELYLGANCLGVDCFRYCSRYCKCLGSCAMTLFRLSRTTTMKMRGGVKDCCPLRAIYVFISIFISHIACPGSKPNI